MKILLRKIFVSRLLSVVCRRTKNEHRLTTNDQRPSRSEGFTLLEVLVATMVISLAMAGLMSIFLVVAKQSGTTVNKGSAAFYQKRILDELRQYIVDSPWGHGTVDDNPPASGGFGEIHHTCTRLTGSASTHYILAAGNHDAIRTDGTSMLPSSDDLVTKFGATASYAVTDNADGTKRIQVNVSFTEPTL